jgi:exopolysaccharide production protein ExoZ
MQTSGFSKISDLRGIQYLRGIAALSVLIFHTCTCYRLGFDVGAAGVLTFSSSSAD